MLAINGRNPSQGGFLSMQSNGSEVGSIGANSQFNFQTTSGIVTQFYTGSNPTLPISSNGNVLINQISQANTGYKLDIAGAARANEIVVNLTGADFVFEKDYKLSKLTAVKDYLDKNHHLPGIAPADEMSKSGVALGELDNKLLQKVEELTLYIIRQNQRIDQLESRLNKQSNPRKKARN